MSNNSSCDHLVKFVGIWNVEHFLSVVIDARFHSLDEHVIEATFRVAIQHHLILSSTYRGLIFPHYGRNFERLPFPIWYYDDFHISGSRVGRSLTPSDTDRSQRG